MGFDDPAQLDAADAATAAYFAETIPVGEFYGWLAVTSANEAVGSGGAVIDQHPPGPSNLSGQIGHVMSLATVPHYRRRGIGRRIMQAMLKWLAEQGIQRVALHATGMGRPLYEELGFVDGNEMQLRLGRDGEKLASGENLQRDSRKCNVTAALEKVRRLERYLEQRGGYADRVLDRTIDKVLQRERDQMQTQLARIQRRLATFERQCGWSTPEFYEQFEEGDLGDEADFFEWSASWEMVQELRQGLALLS